MSTPKNIEDTKIGENLVADPDLIFDEQALPATATITSPEFRLGNVMGMNEIKTVVDTGGTLSADLTVNIRSSAATGGSKSTVQSFTVAAGAVAAGDDLVKWIPPRETTDCFFDMQLITTADESAIEVSASHYLVGIG